VKTYRFILTGLGNIGRNFLAMLLTREKWLSDRYGLALQAVGVADSSGAIYAPEGLNMAAVVAQKEAKRRVIELAAPGQWQGEVLALTEQAEAEFLLEATPTNLVDGQPGLNVVRTALQRGRHAVLASKGPLVLAYQELAGLSDLLTPSSPALRFSGAVGGGLPSINIGRRDLAGAQIKRVEAVVNGTTQLILWLMTQGQSYEAALAEAKRIGIAEPDPALDVEGWDAANKLVIIANAVLGYPAKLADVAVTGISGVSRTELQAAHAAGGRISLLAVAEILPSEVAPGHSPAYRLSVTPTALATDHPLAHLKSDEMGIVYYTDIYGRTVATTREEGPLGTCAAMLRDIIDIVKTYG
jgi:homoserine dehydrogenase